MSTPAPEVFNYDNLFAGNGLINAVPQAITIKGISGTYAPGTVLANNAGVYEKVDAASETAAVKVPVCVLAESVTTAAANVKAFAYFTGDSFNKAALSFGGTDTIATHIEALRAAKIFVTDLV
jgi:hypothetical protein